MTPLEEAVALEIKRFMKLPQKAVTFENDLARRILALPEIVKMQEALKQAPEAVANPSPSWCDQYADWFERIAKVRVELGRLEAGINNRKMPRQNLATFVRNIHHDLQPLKKEAE